MVDLGLNMGGLTPQDDEGLRRIQAVKRLAARTEIASRLFNKHWEPGLTRKQSVELLVRCWEAADVWVERSLSEAEQAAEELKGGA